MRVLFLDTEVAKWKAQSLFELMRRSGRFEPVMAISRRDADLDADSETIQRGIDGAVAYFTRMGNACEVVYDVRAKSGKDLRAFGADLVFHQQPWDFDKELAVWDVASHALPCYIPYYVVNYYDKALDARLVFHRFLAYYFAQNEAACDYFRAGSGRLFYSGRFVPTGHPALDGHVLRSPFSGPKRHVIYAPHFSVSSDNILWMSTFLENGRQILAYAQDHPDLGWAFKPHPNLRRTLVTRGGWSEKDVDDYYAAWARLGTVCLDGQYERLFDEAYALITDCGSFLPEFAATGSPIIHLVAEHSRIHPKGPAVELFDTFYQVHGLGELRQTLDEVLVRRLDPKRDRRLAVVRRQHLTDTYAAQNILDFLSRELGITPRPESPEQPLGRQTLRGFAWTLLERLGTQFVGFLVTIVLARLLTPGDYGVIGMLGVFLSFSQMLVDCGFASALVRKKDRSDADFSTAFWFNLAASSACYVTLALAAPLIAAYYRQPALTGLLRVLGLSLVVNALFAIQVTRLTAQMEFKLQAKVSIISCLVSGVVGIVLACRGCGAWAIVGQTLSCGVVSGLMYWSTTGWRPGFRFSTRSFCKLFGFGSKIVAANFLHTVYTNVSPLIVGRKYTPADLGFYSRADSLAGLPGGILQGTLGRVAFPALSALQDDEPRLRRASGKYLRLSVSIVSPLLLLLAACAEPLIVLLIGEKWLPCVPYLRLLAIGWMVDPIVIVNLNILYVKGRSDLVLKLEIVKKLVAIAIVVAAVQYGVLWLCAGRVIYSYVALALNLHVCGPFIGKGLLRQLREVAPIYVGAFSSAAIAHGAACFGMSRPLFAQPCLNGAVVLVAAGLAGLVAYAAFAVLLRLEILAELKRALTAWRQK